MIGSGVFVLTLLISISVGQAGECPDGWMIFHDSCYYFADDNLADWTESAHFCQIHHHAQLAVIDSKEEDLMVMDHLRHLYKPGSDHNVWFWLGASDTEIDGIWKWYTNDRVFSGGYVNWRTGQPENHDGEDCLCYYGPRGFVGWDDHFCDTKAHAICERNLTSQTEEIIG